MSNDIVVSRDALGQLHDVLTHSGYVITFESDHEEFEIIGYLRKVKGLEFIVKVLR